MPRPLSADVAKSLGGSADGENHNPTKAMSGCWVDRGRCECRFAIVCRNGSRELRQPDGIPWWPCDARVVWLEGVVPDLLTRLAEEPLGAQPVQQRENSVEHGRSTRCRQLVFPCGDPGGENRVGAQKDGAQWVVVGRCGEGQAMLKPSRSQDLQGPSVAAYARVPAMREADAR